MIKVLKNLLSVQVGVQCSDSIRVEATPPHPTPRYQAHYCRVFSKFNNEALRVGRSAVGCVEGVEESGSADRAAG